MPGPGQNQHCRLCRSHRQAKGVQSYTSNTLQWFGKLLTRPTSWLKDDEPACWLIYVYKSRFWIEPGTACDADVGQCLRFLDFCWMLCLAKLKKLKSATAETVSQVFNRKLLLEMRKHWEKLGSMSCSHSALRSWFHELLRHKTWVTVSL